MDLISFGMEGVQIRRETESREARMSSFCIVSVLTLMATIVFHIALLGCNALCEVRLKRLLECCV